MEWAAARRFNEAGQAFHHCLHTASRKQQHWVSSPLYAPLRGVSLARTQLLSGQRWVFSVPSGWRSFLLNVFSSEGSDSLLCGMNLTFLACLYGNTLFFLCVTLRVSDHPLVLQYVISPPQGIHLPLNETIVHPETCYIIEESFPPPFSLCHMSIPNILWFGANSSPQLSILS